MRIVVERNGSSVWSPFMCPIYFGGWIKEVICSGVIKCINYIIEAICRDKILPSRLNQIFP